MKRPEIRESHEDWCRDHLYPGVCDCGRDAYNQAIKEYRAYEESVERLEKVVLEAWRDYFKVTAEYKMAQSEIDVCQDIAKAISREINK